MRKQRLEPEAVPFVVECPSCGTQSKYVEGSKGWRWSCEVHGEFTVGEAVAREARRRHGE